MRKLLLWMALAVPLVALAAPMTNDDVVRMVRGGLGDATVIQAIDAAVDPAFDTSADGLIRMKQGGVSEAVIQRVLARRGAPAAVAPAPVAAPAPVPAPAAQPAACRDCGVIVAIREIEIPGQASGAGAVAGGVLGAVVGRQIAGRDSRTAGTVVGAAGGAVAGHQIEKHAKSGKTWEIGVRFDDGRSQSYRQDTQPMLRSGDPVRVVNGVVGPR